MYGKYEDQIPRVFSDLHAAVIAGSMAREARDVLSLGLKYAKLEHPDSHPGAEYIKLEDPDAYRGEDRAKIDDPDAHTAGVRASAQIARIARTLLEQTQTHPMADQPEPHPLTLERTQQAWLELLDFDRMRIGMGHIPEDPEIELEEIGFNEGNIRWYANQYHSIATEWEQDRLNDEWIKSTGETTQERQQELQHSLIQAMEQVSKRPQWDEISYWPFEEDPLAEVESEGEESEEDTDNPKFSLQDRAEEAYCEVELLASTARWQFMQNIGILISPEIEDQEAALDMTKHSERVISECNVNVLYRPEETEPEILMAFLYQGNIHVKRIEDQYPEGFPKYLAMDHIEAVYSKVDNQEDRDIPLKTLIALHDKIEATPINVS